MKISRYRLVRDLGPFKENAIFRQFQDNGKWYIELEVTGTLIKSEDGRPIKAGDSDFEFISEEDFVREK